MPRRTVRIGTRGSPMALAQAARVGDALVAAGPQVAVETVVISTHGDRWMGALSAGAGGGKGAFVREIDAQLSAGAIDLAVHCLKDIPGDTPIPDELCHAAYLPRDDIRDCAVHGPDAGWTLAEAPPDTVVGTSSVRRRAQLARHLPHLHVVPMRGNVNTRLRKLDQHQDGVNVLILALVGLHRVGEGHRVSEILDPNIMAPPVGAGVLVVQTRADDSEIRDLVAPLNDQLTTVAATAERTMLAHLHGHCNSPITGHASITGNQLTLRAAVYAPDGTRWLEAMSTGPVDEPAQVGAAAAETLLNQGARELIDAIPH